MRMVIEEEEEVNDMITAMVNIIVLLSFMSSNIVTHARMVESFKNLNSFCFIWCLVTAYILCRSLLFLLNSAYKSRTVSEEYANLQSAI